MKTHDNRYARRDLKIHKKKHGQRGRRPNVDVLRAQAMRVPRAVLERALSGG